MDIGTGVAIGCSVAGGMSSIAAVVVVAIRTRAAERMGKNSNEVCPLHSGISSTLAYVKERMDVMEETLQEGLNLLQQDIKHILMKIGG